MASPGLKRPLDIEAPPNTNSCGASGSSEANNSTPTTNGGGITKRRCTTNFYPLAQSRIDLMGNINHNMQQVLDSPFNDLSSVLNDLSEDIAALIKDELNTVYESISAESNEPPILNARQTQVICEKLIKDREQKIRDEYDRILARKLAEQYDLLTKANYLNSYVNPTTRMPTPANATPPNSNQAVSAAAAVAANHQSINALAAAFTSMQRSAGVSAAANPVTTSPNIQDLTALAASLTNSGHPSAITSRMAYNLQHQAVAAMQAQQHHRVPSNNSTLPCGPVLLASNIDEQLATPEALFTLFGVFGDVIRVKILFNKKDNALIQMADANQAQVAQGYLDKQKVFGKMIRVTRSKHQLVQMPRDGNQSDAGLTKDFTNSQLHRFKIPGSRNYLNIYPPSNTLHISNIPAAIDEKDLHKAFKEQCSFEYSSFKFFPKGRKMALMKFNSIEHATIALIKMHNFQISDENNLRVSFSKSVMQS